MKNEILLQNWYNADLKQLEIFYKNNCEKIIYINSIEYTINSICMNKNNVPTIELLNKNTKCIEYVCLSLLDKNYINYSSLSIENKTKLLIKLKC